MANTFIPADQVAPHFMAIIDKHASELPADMRLRFKAACLESLGATLFNGPVAGRSRVFRNVR